MNSDVGGTLKYVITAETQEFQKALDKAGKQFDEFADKLNQGGSKAGKGLQDSVTQGSNESAKAFRKFVDDSLGALGQFTSALGKVSFNSFTTAAGAASTAMSAMVGKGMNIGSSLEKNRLSFEALTGSVKGAETVLTSVANFASENPYQLLDVSNVARELVAMGRSADDVAPDLARLGAIGVATGADLGALGHVYGQISAQGKMMTQDMYQLVNQGVAIMPALSKVTGKSMTELKDFISEGGVTMEVFTKAMGQIVDPEMYENLLNKMNNTIPRQMDRLKGSISTFATSLVGIDKWTGQKLETGLAQTYTNILKKLADNLRNPQLIASVQKLGISIAKMIDKFVPLIDKIAPALTKAFDTLADHTELLLPIVGGALVMFGNLGSNLPGIGPIIGNLSNSIKGLGGSLLNLFKVNPVLGVFVTMLGVGLPKALKNANVRESIGKIISALGKLGQALAPVMAKIAEVMATVGSKVIESTLLAITPIIEALANVITSIPTPVLTKLVEAILALLVVKKVTGPLKTFGHAAKVAFDVFSTGNGIKNAVDTFKELTGFGKKAAEAAKTATGTMKSVGKVGKATTNASQSLTKGQKMMNTMRSGILNLILLAGAIAALGFALKLAYETIPGDLGGLAAKMGVMVGVVAAMGALAFAAGKIKSINAKSIITLTALAVPMIAFAGALKLIDMVVPNEFGNLAIKLGILGGAITAMAVLAGIVGKFAGNEVKGILIIVGFAADLALLGLALKVVDDSLPNDFGTFALKLANVGIAVAGMAILAGIIGNFPLQMAIGLIAIAGIAGDIALVGLALGVVDREIQSDFGTLVGKLGAMGLAITEFGVLAGVIGALLSTGIGALFLGAGLAGILAITGGMVVVAEALGEIDRVVPSNVERLLTKIDGMKACLDKMSDAAFGNVLKNFVGMINIAELAAIAAIYSQIGDILAYLQTIEINEEAVKSKIETIKRCIELVSATDEDSVGGLFKQVIKDFLNLVDVDLARRTLEVYTTIAENLNHIQSIPIDYNTINSKVQSIKDIVNLVAASDDKSIAQAIAHTCKQFLDTVDTENVSKVINTYKDIAENLNKIQSIEINYDTVEEQVGKIKRVIDLVSYNGDDSLFALLIKGAKQAEDAKAQENAGKILGVYATAVDSLKKIQEFEFNEETLKGKIIGIRNIVYEAGQVNELGGLENKEKIVGLTQSIINKFREIGDTLNEIKPLNENVENTIIAIRNCVYQAGAINEGAGKENQEQIVARSQSIINKFKEIAEVLNNIPKIADGAEQNIINIRNAVYQAGSINQNAGKENQETIVARTQSIIHKFKEIAEVLNQIPGLNPAVETNITNIRNAIYLAGQINQSGASENQELIVARSQSIIHKYKEIAEVLNAIPGLNPAVETNITNIRNAIYQVGQINETPNLEFKEWVVGVSQSILHKFKEFAEVANTILPISEEAMAAIRNIRHMVWEVGQINEVENMEGKLNIVNMAVEILRRLAEFSQVASTVVTVEQGTFDAISRICTVINTSITQLVSNLNAQLPNFITIGQQMANNIWNGWSSFPVLNNISNDANNLTNELRNKSGEFYNIGSEWSRRLSNGFNSTDLGAKGRSAGEAVGYGFGNGISSTVWRINSAMGQLSTAAITKLKSLLGIASPSKVMFALGAYTGEGFADGIESQYKQVANAAQGMADLIREPFDELNGLGVSVAGQVSGSENSGNQYNKTLTVNQNNTINNNMDYNVMMADLRWQLFTA